MAWVHPRECEWGAVGVPSELPGSCFMAFTFLWSVLFHHLGPCEFLPLTWNLRARTWTSPTHSSGNGVQ